MTTHILVVDNDAELLEALTDVLGRAGMAVSALRDVSLLEARVEREPPDLIVLNQSAQVSTSLAALARLRAAGNDVPVILTASANDTDRIVGLEMGADDCLDKPFNPRELAARVRAILRRRNASLAAATQDRHPVATFGPYTLDLRIRTLTLDGSALFLSAAEFALLKVFVENPMRTLTRTRLLELLHGPTDEHTDRGVDVQVWRLRRILEADPSAPRFIQTVRSHGYVFVPDGARHALQPDKARPRFDGRSARVSALREWARST